MPRCGLDDGTTEVTATTASTLKLGGSDNAPSVAGYVYITIDKLGELKLRPASDFSGEVKLVYQVGTVSSRHRMLN